MLPLVDHQLGISLAVMTWGVPSDSWRSHREGRHRAAAQRAQPCVKRSVWIGIIDGGSALFARLDTADALALKATIDQIAEALQAVGTPSRPINAKPSPWVCWLTRPPRWSC